MWHRSHGGGWARPKNCVSGLSQLSHGKKVRNATGMATNTMRRYGWDAGLGDFWLYQSFGRQLAKACGEPGFLATKHLEILTCGLGKSLRSKVSPISPRSTAIQGLSWMIVAFPRFWNWFSQIATHFRWSIK